MHCLQSPNTSLDILPYNSISLIIVVAQTVNFLKNVRPAKNCRVSQQSVEARIFSQRRVFHIGSPHNHATIPDLFVSFVAQRPTPNPFYEQVKRQTNQT